jgi:hypothetical protein
VASKRARLRFSFWSSLRSTAFPERHRITRYVLTSGRCGPEMAYPIVTGSTEPAITIKRPFMTRIARCSCGSLRVEVLADPMFVIACHCLECQRRTGAPFGVSAYFVEDKLLIDGASKIYTRAGQAGRKATLHFCADCGTTLFWRGDAAPNLVGVAVGAFGDPTFPKPTRSTWEATKHPWVLFDHPVDRFQGSSIATR